MYPPRKTLPTSQDIRHTYHNSKDLSSNQTLVTSVRSKLNNFKASHHTLQGAHQFCEAKYMSLQSENKLLQDCLLDVCAILDTLQAPTFNESMLEQLISVPDSAPISPQDNFVLTELLDDSVDLEELEIILSQGSLQ